MGRRTIRLLTNTSTILSPVASGLRRMRLQVEDREFSKEQARALNIPLLLLLLLFTTTTQFTAAERRPETLGRLNDHGVIPAPGGFGSCRRELE